MLQSPPFEHFCLQTTYWVALGLGPRCNPTPPSFAVQASSRTATFICSFDQPMVWYFDAHHDLDICSSVLPSPDWLSVTVFDSGIVANLWLQLLFLIAKLHPVHRHNSPAATHDFLQFTGLSPRLQLLLLLRIPVPYLNSRSLTKLSIVSFSFLQLVDHIQSH